MTPTTWSIADDKTPLAANDVLTIYCEGLGMAKGDNNLTPVSGVAYAAALYASDAVTVTIGGRTIAPFYAGMTPYLVGLAQVNVQLPAGLPSGLQTLVLSTKSGASNTAMILVQ